MPYETKYVKGTHNAICDICGFQYKADTMRLNWLNQLVCNQDYEMKHPLYEQPKQERSEGMPGPVIRPEPEDVFRETGDVDESSNEY